MKNKIPFKERTRQYDYEFNHTERQCKLAEKRAQELDMEEKLKALKEREKNNA